MYVLCIVQTLFTLFVYVVNFGQCILCWSSHVHYCMYGALVICQNFICGGWCKGARHSPMGGMFFGFKHQLVFLTVSSEICVTFVLVLSTKGFYDQH